MSWDWSEFAIADESNIRDAWESVVSGENRGAEQVRPLIGDAWTRSRLSKVDPLRKSAEVTLDEDGLFSHKRRHLALIESARPVMVQAYGHLVDAGAVMVLTDADGTVLWVEGHHAILERAGEINLVPGGNWGESAMGSNGIGTALVSGRPVRVIGSEHFCEGIGDWGCSGATIRDRFDGRVIGVLDISGMAETHGPGFMGLAMAGAHHIEAQLAAEENEKRARLFEILLDRGALGGHQGLVLFDRKGRIIRAGMAAKDRLAAFGIDPDDRRSWTGTGFLPDGAPAGPAFPAELAADEVEPIMDGEERLGTVLLLAQTRARKEARGGRTDQRKEDSFSAIIGSAPAIAKVRKIARRLAPLPVSVLLSGPTGTGKEVFARALHDGGPNAAGPFVPFNCGAVTRELLPSELFGHAEGAFTGARRGGAPGKFEAADGGTLFLDEIGELPLDLQPMLLRVLEDGVVYRLGENRPRPVRVRVIAATNRDLRAAIGAGRFRADLFYRLAVTRIPLPGLSERKEDLPQLVAHFIEQAANRHGMASKTAGHDLLDALAAHDWPGNIRELRNVVESMVLLTDGAHLTAADLPADFLRDLAAPGALIGSADRSGMGLDRDGGRLIDQERRMIELAIRQENGNLTRAATRLGIAKSTLYEKMKRHAIERFVPDGEGPDGEGEAAA